MKRLWIRFVMLILNLPLIRKKRQSKYRKMQAFLARYDMSIIRNSHTKALLALLVQEANNIVAAAQTASDTDLKRKPQALKRLHNRAEQVRTTAAQLHQNIVDLEHPEHAVLSGWKDPEEETA